MIEYVASAGYNAVSIPVLSDASTLYLKQISAKPTLGTIQESFYNGSDPERKRRFGIEASNDGSRRITRFCNDAIRRSVAGIRRNFAKE